MKIVTIALIFSVLIGMMVAPATAQPFERKKFINKSFAVNENCQITITNKYGNVQVQTWNKDSVRFEISFAAYANKLQTLDAMYTMVDVNFTNSIYYVVATTSFTSGQANIIDDLNVKMRTLFSGGNSLSINYTVYVPAHSNIKIENRYGNVSVGDVFGNLTVLLKNGDLKIGNVNGYLNLKVDYGNTSAKTIKDASVSYSFGEFDVVKVDNLDISSRSTKISVEEVNDLKLNSQKDKIFIGKVNNVNGIANFSSLNIINLNESMGIKTIYGDLNLINTDPKFSALSFEGNFTEMKIELPRSASYELKIERSDNSTVTLPVGAKIVSTNIIDPKKKTSQTIARVGKDNPSARVFLKVNSSKVVFLH